jgi:hypothetical protein
MARRTLEMAGLDKTPDVAVGYQALGLVYDITSRREKAWKKAEISLVAYQQNPSNAQLESIINQAEVTGFFSVWMHIFSACPDVKIGLVRRFNAVPTCFDQHGNSVNPRKLGRI